MVSVHCMYIYICLIAERLSVRLIIVQVQPALVHGVLV